MIINKSDSARKNPATRVLVIDEKAADASRVRSLLSENGNGRRFSVTRSCTLSFIKQKLEQKQFDVVLLSPLSGSLKRNPLLKILKSANTPPVIGLVESRADIPSLGVPCIQCLVKASLSSTLLTNAVSMAVEQRSTSRGLQENIREFQHAEARFLNVILSSKDGIVIIDKRKKILFINPAALEMLSIEEKKTGVFPFPVRSGNAFEIRIDGKRGSGKVLEARTVETVWEGAPARLLSLRDITARKFAEDSLRASEERYSLAIRGSKNGVWDWNLLTDEIYFCDQWKSTLGYSSNQIENRIDEWFSRIHSSDIKKVRKKLQDHLDGKTQYFENEHRIQHKNGSYRWVQVRGTALRDKRGWPVRIAGSLTDVTERKLAEKQLNKALDDLRLALASEKVLMEELDRKNKQLVELSITDGLTGLYNHRFLQERFDFEFKRVHRYGGELSCMLIDVDHFKIINDTYGHQFGDFVLRQLATIMKTKSREVDICGRYGGEEFLIISNQKAENALIFASKLHSAIDSYVFQHDNRNVHVTVSIGVAEYRNDIKTKQELIERADTALYQAKKEGRNLIRVWKDFDSQEEKTIDRSGIQELKSKLQEISQKVRNTYMESIDELIRAVDAKDPFAREHSKKVAEYSVKIARYQNLPEQEIEVVRNAALLHDIGKISIRNETLVKTEELTSREYEILKRHPDIAVNMLKDLKFLEKEIPYILHHHERYDGSGYPHGLRGREIPAGARIIAVADAFDAMISGRTYKKRLHFTEAVKELKRGSGTQFAPEIVEVFLKLIKAGEIELSNHKEKENITMEMEYETDNP
ncbi:MAG TPA: diguanylate cyclase [Chitinispirillaceae bacterium]|nr:diguanylate cyclase [Chitinispirillaceae bacterium]